MDLELSADELELRDNVRAVLAALCPPSLVRSVFEGKSTPDALWERMVELDWPAIAVPERFGGIDGGSADDVVVVAQGEDGLGAFVVEGNRIGWSQRTVIDPTICVADAILDGVEVEDDRVLAEPSSPAVTNALARVLDEATIA